MDNLILIKILIGIWILYSAIAFIIRTIKQKIKDAAAKKVFLKINLDLKNELREIDKKMSQVGVSHWKDISFTTINSSFKYNIKICPQCRRGILIERIGKQGLSIACSDYPKCPYIDSHYKPIEETENDVLSKMREAYKI